MKSEFGVIGLGVMGKSISRNLARNGFRLSLFNRYVPGKEENVAEDFVTQFPELKKAVGFQDIKAFIKSLDTPRKIFLMISAGEATDELLEEIQPLLQVGDIVIDGGNSYFKDTERRVNQMQEKGFLFIGTGVSGGEEGALNGPSIMPGGDEKAYKQIKPFLDAIAAKDEDGNPCSTYVGEGGSGHFVKMVHNGIEYAEMQLLAEVYQILRFSGQKAPEEIADILEQWLEDELSSYLLEITVDILRKKEKEKYLIDIIVDQAGNKGTGGWTTAIATELGEPATMITAALFGRYLSEIKKERENAENIFGITEIETKVIDVEAVKNAYQLARLINHHQGVKLISTASQQYDWGLNLSEIARIWTNGCIIRSELMKTLIHILEKTDNILLDPYFLEFAKKSRVDLSTVVSSILAGGQSIPCLSAALNYINGYSASQSGANIIQAQRDYFGAHTYKRKDDPSGKAYHTIWKD